MEIARRTIWFGTKFRDVASLAERLREHQDLFFVDSNNIMFRTDWNRYTLIASVQGNRLGRGYHLRVAKDVPIQSHSPDDIKSLQEGYVLLRALLNPTWSRSEYFRSRAKELRIWYR